MAGGVILVATGLEKRFGAVRAVAGVSFAVAASEMLALIGPNGAGKSTCFDMLNGQLRPDAGTVLLDGLDATGLTPARMFRRGVGRTFQVTATYASMTVRENVQTVLLAQAGALWGMWRGAAELHAPAARALLAQVGLEAAAERAAGVLAYGDLKRLELAMALAHGPRLLLMDEPTAGMAAEERDGLMRLVRRLATERGLAVLFTEHDMDAVFAFADRIVVLDQGRVIADGSPDRVRADARVRRVYLGTA